MKFLFSQNALSLYCGESRSFDVQLNKPDGTPYNLEDYKVFLTVKKLLTDEYATIYKTSDVNTQISLVTPRTGLIRIFFKSADTRLIAPGVYLYDCWVEDADGESSIVIEPSEFEIKPAVTKK